MNKKTLFSSYLILGLAALLVGCLSSTQVIPREPIIFSGESGSIPEMDIDTLILESNLVVIGKFDSIPPSQWNTPDGTLPEDTTAQTVWDQGLFIYTEQVFQPREILKPDPQEREILVRSFGGQVGEDIMETSNLDVIYAAEQEYLLFLSYYPDRVEDDTPGYYIASGSIQGVYKIVDDVAVSYRDDWPLSELVAYIQQSQLSKVEIQNTPDTQAIMNQLEITTTVEIGCSFDFSIFPSIYINDPRYEVDEEKIKFIRMATENPSLETAGYLDYKNAYHSWWLEGKRQWEELYAKARAENREISEEEQNEFNASKWGAYRGGWCSPKASSKLRFVSITFNEDMASVVLGVNDNIREVNLVLVNGQWMIAQENNLTPSP
ncbi:MAG: hypothetical protein HYZ21_00710 [Chloroflexi bacterium]|nr:hypothetical protein [Chloroflexota bacterium]